MKAEGKCLFCGKLHQTFSIDTCIRQMWRSMPPKCNECGGADGHRSSCSIGQRVEVLIADGMEENQAQLVAEFNFLPN